jgi:hypothetical protein
MTTRTHRQVLIGAIALAAFVTGGAGPAFAGNSSSAGGSAQSGYNAIPSKVTGNVPSYGFEAESDTALGDEVGLGGTARGLQSMSVVMSSWACESGSWIGGDCATTPGATFQVPLTFSVYADDAGTLGAPLATQTQTVAIGYRPSASTQCTGGRWYNSKDRTCYNGLPQTVKMTFAGQQLPAQVIWTVTYNTTHHGPAPLGEAEACYSESGGCGYDSLNVGTFSFANSPYAGTDVNADQLFRNGAMEGGHTGERPLGAIVTK